MRVEASLSPWLVFVTRGTATVSFGARTSGVLSAGEMAIIPAFKSGRVVAQAGADVMVTSFDMRLYCCGGCKAAELLTHFGLKTGTVSAIPYGGPIAGLLETVAAEIACEEIMPGREVYERLLENRREELLFYLFRLFENMKDKKLPHCHWTETRMIEG